MAARRLLGGAGGARRSEFITTGLRALSSKTNGHSKGGTCDGSDAKLDKMKSMETNDHSKRGTCDGSDAKLDKMKSMEENLRTEHRVYSPQLSDLIKVAKRSTSTTTMSFAIKSGKGTTGDVKNLMEVMDADARFFKSNVEEDPLKEEYFSLVRPALRARCLLSPYKIDDPEASGLHEAYKKIMGLRYPYYMSSRDLMITLKCMEKKQWVYFLDFLNAKRVLVIEDWCNSFRTLFGVGRFDLGLKCAPDGTEYYRGMCDASVKDGKARISSIIWKENQVIACQVLVDIPVEQKKGDEKGKQASAKAEAIAMYYLLKLAISQGIQNLQVSTDNRTVDEVLRGMHEITEESDCKDIYKLLQYLKRNFSSLVSRWEPRENLYPADGLIRSFDHGTDPGNVQDLLRKWSYHLNGYPIFYLTEKKCQMVMKLDDKSARLPSIQEVCYFEVEERDKFDTFLHMCKTLRPSRVFVTVQDTGSRELVEQLKEQFEKECDFRVTAYDGYSVISFSLTHRNDRIQSKKLLKVIYDWSVPLKDLDEDNSLKVMLLTPEERRQGTTRLNIPEYGPMSFASFHTEKTTTVQTTTRNPRVTGVSGIF